MIMSKPSDSDHWSYYMNLREYFFLDKERHLAELHNKYLILSFTFLLALAGWKAFGHTDKTIDIFYKYMLILVLVSIISNLVSRSFYIYHNTKLIIVIDFIIKEQNKVANKLSNLGNKELAEKVKKIDKSSRDWIYDLFGSTSLKIYNILFFIAELSFVYIIFIVIHLISTYMLSNIITPCYVFFWYVIPLIYYTVFICSGIVDIQATKNKLSNDFKDDSN